MFRSKLQSILFHSHIKCRGLVIQDVLKLNSTHQFLVYADDVNTFGGSVHTIKENAEALVVVRKETGLEINADENKYMVIS